MRIVHLGFFILLAGTPALAFGESANPAAAKREGSAEVTDAAGSVGANQRKSASEESAMPRNRKAAVSSIAVEALENFEKNSPKIQQLIRTALDLTRLNLTYTFGSSDPKQGGMDCSGTIYHLLRSAGVAGVPRQSDQMAGWVQERAVLNRITHADSLAHAEFAALQPGDLLFWSSTYPTSPRVIPVSHVMLYLGKLKSSGRHVVFGASDGRVYEGQKRTGVSVFDFTLPKLGSPARFYGYGIVPGLGQPPAKLKEHVIAATPAATKPEAVPKEEIRRAESVVKPGGAGKKSQK